MFSIFLYLIPFSVTLSQAFAILSILCYLITKKPKFKDFPTVFYLGLVLYLWILLTRCWNPDLGKLTGFPRILTHSEFSDFWMLFLLLPGSKFTKAEKTILRQTLKKITILLILIGVISVFSPYRLANFVMDGFTYVEGRRLPHQFAYINVLELPLFLPIGFQNTHLTYGGLLALFLPALFFQAFRLVKIQMQRKRIYRISLFFYLGLSMIGLILLLLNQSRSIWLGLLISLLLIIRWKKIFDFFKNYYLLMISSFLGLALLFFFLVQVNWLFRRSIEQLFTKQTLENQRVWIHKANFNILKYHFTTGIGSGNYREAFENSYFDLIAEKPYLYYEIFITPKSHAHHDFIHFFILGGVWAGFLFICIWYLLLNGILDQKRKTPIFLGIYAIFIGGMFQCYFLDDEILLPLLAIYGLTSISNNFDFKSKVKSSFSIILPLFLSLVSVYFLSNTEADKLFIHRTRDQNNFLSPLSQKSINGEYQIVNRNSDNQFYFKLEGCLSHLANIGGIKSPRTSPLRLAFGLPLGAPVKSNPFPVQYEIELRERDSFDQDVRFRAHSESVIQLFQGEFHPGNNTLEIKVPEKSIQSELKFWDLGVRYFYSNGKEDFLLPIINIGENCD